MCAVIESALCTDYVPELIIAEQLGISVSRLFHYGQRLIDFRTVEQFLWHISCLLFYLSQISEPQHLHLLLRDSLGSKFRQFDKDKMQPVYHLVGIHLMHHPVVVIVVIHVFFKDIVDDVERIDRLQESVVLTAVHLPYVRLGRIEHHSLHEFPRPYHLHLDNKLPSPVVPASYIDDAVLAQRCLRNQFCREVFY